VWKDFFDLKNNPYITFKSTKIVQTGPALSGKGTGSGIITGTMAFDRKQYGMNSESLSSG